MTIKNERMARLNESKADWVLNKQSMQRLAAERKFVRVLLHGCGLSAEEIGLMSPSNAEEDDFYLTLGWLHQTFNDIPIRVVYYPELSAVPSCDILSDLRRGSPLWKQWRIALQELSGEMDNGYGIGMLFGTHDIVGDRQLNGNKLIYNLALPSYPSESEGIQTEVLITGKDEKDRAYCSSVKHFVSRLSEVWKAKTSDI